jgi:Lrp/AsnC family leucine-responsive transcriptional regulator
MKELTKTNQRILEILQANGRATYASIAGEVGLSAPAVKERILKLEEAGVITGYAATVSEAALGYNIAAFILVQVPGDRDRAFGKFVQSQPPIRECYHVLGDRAFVLRVYVHDMQELEMLIKNCLNYGSTTTYMQLSRVK